MFGESNLIEEIENLIKNHPESYELIKNLSFVVFDLETTGGNHKNDKIIEIGMVKIENLELASELSYLVDPKIPIPEFIQKLTSIKPEKLKGAPVIEDIIDELMEFMGDSVLVAHNASFDVPFFNSVLRRMDREPLKNRSICTNLMSKYLIPEIMNSNLNYMSRIFNIRHDKAHRALDDAQATAHLLIKFLEFFIEKDIRKINQLYYPLNKFELDRYHFKAGSSWENIEKKASQAKSPMIISLKGEQGVLQTILAIEDFSKEKEFIKSQFDKNIFHTFTIKMKGNFFEAFLKMNNQFPKISIENQDAIIEHIFKQHLGQAPGPCKVPKKDLPTSYQDFLLTTHLIPEQYILYPLFNLQIKNELIFRYPGHKKKMSQYVTNQIRRMETLGAKKTRAFIQKRLLDFYQLYLHKLNANSDSRTLFFSSKSFKDKRHSFEDFSKPFFSKNKKTYPYPTQHI